jgi:hypothetical protein
LQGHSALFTTAINMIRGEINIWKGFWTILRARPGSPPWPFLSDFVEKGDLMLTDLGYFKLATFQNLITKGAFFLSRSLIG